MKTLFSLALILALIPSAFAAKKTASLDQLQKAVQSEFDIIKDATDCKVELSRTSASLLIQATREDGKKVKLEVSELDRIELFATKGSDGFSNLYHIEGVGAVRVVHAGDAYDLLDITDGKGTVSCEVDY